MESSICDDLGQAHFPLRIKEDVKVDTGGGKQWMSKHLV